MCVCVCVCVLDSFVFKQQVLFRVDFLSVALDHRGQNLGHLKKSFVFLLLFFSYVTNHI